MSEFDGALVIWELTQACDLVCRERDGRELTTAEAYALLERIAASGGSPRLWLTGGDPLKRPDLFNIIRRSVSLGLHTGVMASSTPLLTHAAVAHFKDSGATCMAVGLDGATRAVDDGYARALAALRSAARVGLETQVDTTLTRRNTASLPALSAIVARERARRWSVFAGGAGDGLTADEYESALAFLHRINLTVPFELEIHAGCAANAGGRRLTFVSHTGEIVTAATWRPSRCSRYPPPVLEAAC